VLRQRCTMHGGAFSSYSQARTHGRTYGRGWAPEPVHGFAVGCPRLEEQTSNGFWSSGLYSPFRVQMCSVRFGQWCWLDWWSQCAAGTGRRTTGPRGDRRHARALDKGQGQTGSHHGRPCPCQWLVNLTSKRVCIILPRNIHIHLARSLHPLPLSIGNRAVGGDGLINEEPVLRWQESSVCSINHMADSINEEPYSVASKASSRPATLH